MAGKINADMIRQMVCYYYLVNYWAPDYIDTLVSVSEEMRQVLAKQIGLSVEEFSNLIIPEVASRIMTFHQASPKPDPEAVNVLSQVMKRADHDLAGATAYQRVMDVIAIHPGRAKPENRLHNQKGCKFCMTPCRYGYFSLMSEPDFVSLKAMLDAENQKLADQRNGVNVLWKYTREHFWGVIGAKEGYIAPEHLGNLAYCLLMLGTAKSRFALPEKELLVIQALNQRAIQNLSHIDISLAVE